MTSPPYLSQVPCAELCIVLGIVWRMLGLFGKKSVECWCEMQRSFISPSVISGLGSRLQRAYCARLQVNFRCFGSIKLPSKIGRPKVGLRSLRSHSHFMHPVPSHVMPGCGLPMSLPTASFAAFHCVPLLARGHRMEELRLLGCIVQGQWKRLTVYAS